MEEQQEKTQGKTNKIKNCGRFFLVDLLLKRVHIWWRLCDCQPDEEKVRR